MLYTYVTFRTGIDTHTHTHKHLFEYWQKLTQQAECTILVYQRLTEFVLLLLLFSSSIKPAVCCAPDRGAFTLHRGKSAIFGGESLLCVCVNNFSVMTVDKQPNEINVTENVCPCEGPWPINFGVDRVD